MSQYTGRDHILAAFERKHTDRVPTRVIQGLAPGLPLTNITPKEVRTQPEKFVEVMIALHKVTPSDAVSILIEDEALIAEACGTKAGFTRQEVASLTQRGIPLIQDKSAFTNFELPDLSRGTRLPYYLDICQIASDEMRDTATDPMISAPWTVAIAWRGMENLIYDTADDPGFVRELLGYTTSYAKMIADSVLATGATTVTFVEPSASCSVITPDMFRTWVKPCLEEIARHARQQKEKPVILHICGYVDPVLEDMVSIGFDGLSIDQTCSLQRALEVSQGKTVVIGNASTMMFLEGTKQEIEKAVIDCIDTAAEESGYILCSGCTVPDNAPLENVRHFLEFGQRYGADYISRLREARPHLFAAE